LSLWGSLEDGGQPGELIPGNPPTEPRALWSYEADLLGPIRAMGKNALRASCELGGAKHHRRYSNAFSNLVEFYTHRRGHTAHCPSRRRYLGALKPTSRDRAWEAWSSAREGAEKGSAARRPLPPPVSAVS
jgi:hypothetical protein